MKSIDLKKILKGFVFAFSGMIGMFKTEVNARIHLIMTTVVIVGGVFFNVSTMEWSILVLAIALVLMAEAFNTAIEYLTDLASPEYHPLAGKAKDAAAGAVLIMSIGAAIVGFIVFLPKVLDWILG